MFLSRALYYDMQVLNLLFSSTPVHVKQICNNHSTVLVNTPVFGGGVPPVVSRPHLFTFTCIHQVLKAFSCIHKVRSATAGFLGNITFIMSSPYRPTFQVVALQ